MSEDGTKQAAVRFCPSCGRALKEEFLMCPYCGKDVSGKAEADNHVEGAIGRYLLRNEQIIQMHARDASNDLFYATNKRLIKQKSSLIGQAIGSVDFGADFLNVDFNRITSITQHKYYPRGPIIAGLFLSLFSIFFFSLPAPSSSSGIDIRIYTGGMFLFFGLICVVFSLCFKGSYYQINIRNPSKKELKDWRIDTTRKGKKEKESIKSFINIIQNKIDQQECSQSIDMHTSSK